MHKLGFLALILLPLFGFAQQDTVYFLDGNIDVGTISEKTDSIYLEFTPLNDKKGGNYLIEKESLFSVYQKGVTRILYAPGNDDFLDVFEMEQFVKGMRKGNNTRCPWYISAGSFAAGFSAAYFGNSLIAGVGSVAPIAIGSAVIPIRKKSLSEEQRLNENFMVGYKKRMRQKQGFNAAIFAISGVIVGLIAL